MGKELIWNDHQDPILFCKERCSHTLNLVCICVPHSSPFVGVPNNITLRNALQFKPFFSGFDSNSLHFLLFGCEGVSYPQIQGKSDHLCQVIGWVTNPFFFFFFLRWAKKRERETLWEREKKKEMKCKQCLQIHTKIALIIRIHEERCKKKNRKQEYSSIHRLILILLSSGIRNEKREDWWCKW